MASHIVPDACVPLTTQIIPVYETDGDTQRLVGFHARCNDEVLLLPGSHTLPHLFASVADAECALHEAALDLFIEAATTADLAALPFEPTVYEQAEQRAHAARDASACDGWPEADTVTACIVTSDGATFRVTTITPATERNLKVRAG